MHLFCGDLGITHAKRQKETLSCESCHSEIN